MVPCKVFHVTVFAVPVLPKIMTECLEFFVSYNCMTYILFD